MMAKYKIPKRCACITEGDTGNGYHIDENFIKQFHECCSKKIKVSAGYSHDDYENLKNQVGYAENFTIEKTRRNGEMKLAVFADVILDTDISSDMKKEEAEAKFNKLKKLTSEHPELIGLSCIHLSKYFKLIEGKKRYLSPYEIRYQASKGVIVYAEDPEVARLDFVGTPASNETLFKKLTRDPVPLNIEELNKNNEDSVMDEELKKILEGLSSSVATLSKDVAGLKKNQKKDDAVPEVKEDKKKLSKDSPDEDNEKDKKIAELEKKVKEQEEAEKLSRKTEDDGTEEEVKSIDFAKLSGDDFKKLEKEYNTDPCAFEKKYDLNDDDLFIEFQ